MKNPPPSSEDGAVAAGAACEPLVECAEELEREVTPVTCDAASAANMPNAITDPATSVVFRRESRSSAWARAIRPCAGCADFIAGAGGWVGVNVEVGG